MIRRLLVFLTCVLAPSVTLAQAPPSRSAPEPAIRRWLDLQTLTLYTRYRFIESNTDIVSSNDLQYRETVRFRVNADARKRVSVNFGVATGASFISSWDNTGLGIGDRDGHNHYFKLLYASVAPAAGLELQAGGLAVVRGESTEYTSYDEDGYLMGERVSLRRPKQLYFDEISITRAALTSTSTPNVFRRFDDFNDQHYTHVLATKRFSTMVAGSADYTRLLNANTIRAAVSIRFSPNAPLSALRFEEYYRTDPSAAGGFSISGERPITKWVRLQGGYTTIDEQYGNLNADRILRGRRFFVLANFTIRGPLTGAAFFTQALHADYTLSNRTRRELLLQYDLLAALRRTGKI